LYEQRSPVTEQDKLYAIREAVQDAIKDASADDVGVMTGYIVISQWTDGEDDFLLTIAGDINDRGASVWQIKGWLNHTLDNIADYFGTDED